MYKLFDLYAIIVILKMGEDKQHFQRTMLYYFKKGKQATETHTVIFLQCMEQVLWLMEHVKRGLQEFRASAFLLNELHDQADQLKLIASNLDTNW